MSAHALAPRPRWPLRAAAPLAAALALSGCASFATMSTARTLPEGAVRVHVAPHLLGAGLHTPPPPAPATPSPEPGHGLRTAATEPGHAEFMAGSIDLDLEVGVRYGLRDDLTVAGRLWALGGAAEAQYQLRRAPSRDGGVDVALGAGASYAGSRSDGTLYLLYAPLLFGIDTSGSDQLVVGPKLALAYLTRPANDSTVLLAGGSLAYSYQVMDGFSLLPEVSVLVPLATPAQRFTWYGLAVEAAIGFVFGR